MGAGPPAQRLQCALKNASVLVLFLLTSLKRNSCAYKSRIKPHATELGVLAVRRSLEIESS